METSTLLAYIHKYLGNDLAEMKSMHYKYQNNPDTTMAREIWIYCHDHKLELPADVALDVYKFIRVKKDDDEKTEALRNLIANVKTAEEEASLISKLQDHKDFKQFVKDIDYFRIVQKEFDKLGSLRKAAKQLSKEKTFGYTEKESIEKRFRRIKKKLEAI